jgi:hypothetical protein
MGYHFSSGDYGADEATDITYVPLSVQADIGSWAMKVTVPYLQVSGPDVVVEGPTGPVVASGAAEGLGDIVLQGAYAVPPWARWMPFVDLIGKVKFPTADEDKGLGTGEFDGTVEIDLSQTVGKLTPSILVGYRFMGEPSGVDLNNVVIASAGAQYAVAPPVTVGLFLDYRQASSAFSEDLLELVPYASWRITRHWTTGLYVAAGLLEGSPDVSVGLHVSYRYSW